MLWICLRKNIPSPWRRQILGWIALDVVLFHYCIRSGYVTIQQPMMYWSEQAQPFSERYIPWFHLILLICKGNYIPSRWRCQVPGWSALAVVLFHYCLRFGYLPIQQPMMYWPEHAQPIVDRCILWSYLILLMSLRKNIPSRWRTRILVEVPWLLICFITPFGLAT